MTDNQKRSVLGLAFVIVPNMAMALEGWPLVVILPISVAWGVILSHFGYSPFQFLDD